MKKTLSLIGLGLVSFLSADQYGYQYPCRGENCGYNQYNYPQQGYYQEQPRYQSRDGYYQRSDGYQGQPQGGYYQRSDGYQGQPQGGYYQRSDGYQGQPQGGYYQRSDGYQGQPQSGYYQRQDGYQGSRDEYDQRQEGYYQKNDMRNQQQDQRNDQRSEKQGSDQEINKDIQDLLAPGMFSNGYPNVTYRVNNGNVQLSGSVESNDDKNKIEEKVRKVKGVRQVSNQITVMGRQVSYNESDTKVRDAEKNYPQDTGNSESDKRLNARIRERISDGWFKNSYEGIILRTNNGVVTILGVVDSDDDIKKINEKIKDIEGIRAVHVQISKKKSD